MGKPCKKLQENGDLPSGKRLQTMGNGEITNSNWGKLTILMAVFNNYVKLLEGKGVGIAMRQFCSTFFGAIWDDWLVVWNMFFSPYTGDNHPN